MLIFIDYLIHDSEVYRERYETIFKINKREELKEFLLLNSYYSKSYVDQESGHINIEFICLDEKTNLHLKDLIEKEQEEIHR